MVIRDSNSAGHTIVTSDLDSELLLPWISATTARECLDIRLLGSQKVQEIEPLIFAGLGYA